MSFLNGDKVRLKSVISQQDLSSIRIYYDIERFYGNLTIDRKSPYNRYSNEDWQVYDKYGTIWYFPLNYLEKIDLGHPNTKIFK